jgi:hypothetical protein
MGTKTEVRDFLTSRRAKITPGSAGLTLRYERLAVDGDPGLEIYAYIAEPGSRSAEAFNFLASYSDRGDLPTHSPGALDV